LKLNGTYHLLIYADDVNIFGGSVHTVKENADVLVVVSKESGLEVNADKTKYMVISRDQNAARKSHTIKNDNTFFEKEEQLNTWKQPKRIILVFIKKLRAV